jgi:hypothetical protein
VGLLRGTSGKKFFGVELSHPYCDFGFFGGFVKLTFGLFEDI